MSEIKNAIAYVRVSTEEQGSDGKYGIEVQKTKILDYCNTNHINVVKIVVEKGSGAKERPLMNQLVFGEGIDNPPFQAIVVYKNDRIARDMQLYFYYEYVLEKRGIKLLCVQDDFLNGIDGSVARLYKSMMQFVAEQERKNITMRTSSGRLAKAKKGGYSGGGVPYGYKTDGNKLILNKEEAKTVKLIYSIYDEVGQSVSKTLKRLKAEKPNLVTRKGKPFVYETVRSIVSNRYFYQGLYHYSSIGWVKGEHAPILEIEDNFFDEESKRFTKELNDEESGEIYG